MIQQKKVTCSKECYSFLYKDSNGDEEEEERAVKNALAM
jgi:hypothetical protein